MNFGSLVNSVEENFAGIAPDDLSRHVYVLASTGSGKSTIIRNLFKHLECANLSGVLASSAIYLDIKDEDSKLFLRQCEKTSVAEDKVSFLDINDSGFGVNLLELPQYDERVRDTIVSRMVGHIVEMFREFYTNSKTFIQMERILRLLLFYLYSNTDKPTMLDLYTLVTRLQKDGFAELQRILHVYKNITGPEMENALRSISKLPKDSWIPLLNRIEMFATDNYLKQKFGVVQSTINFEKMLVPGNITIFRISDTETPKYAHSLIIMALVIKIWFTIQHRASLMPSDKRSLVVLTLDEFQRIQDLSVLTSILSQARAYNLGLILAHQNLAQIGSELLETIVGNTATQIYGRVSGIDAAKIARIIDPHFSEELTDQITVQPDFIFTARTRPKSGDPQGLPIQFKAMQPPPLVLDEKETTKAIEKMRESYKNEDVIHSQLDLALMKNTEWMRQIPYKFYTKEEFDIIRYLRNHNANITKIVEAVQSRDRNKTSEIIQKFRDEGVVVIAHSKGIDLHAHYYFTLSADMMLRYFPDDFWRIGTAPDINEVAKKAQEHYLDKGCFVSIANQNISKDNLRSDMIAYDYQTKTAISIEIESEEEVKSHPEQVRFNMIKWQDLGFNECHVWSKSKKIEQLKNDLGEDAKTVQLFLV